jgi:HD-like signal output (HDOD) protein
LIDPLYIALQKLDVDIDEVICLVSKDLAMSSRLLRMANSASYSRGDAVTSLDQAFSWLGVFQAYRVACITVAAQLAEQNLSAYNISAGRLLANSIAMAVGMEVLAKKTGLDPKTGYTIGLLQHLGRILLQRVAAPLGIPKGAGDLADIQAVLSWEKETFGATHIEAGSIVLSYWGMNPLFGEVLAQQYATQPVTNPTVSHWGALLHLANPLVASTDFGLGVASATWAITDEMLLAAGLPGMAPEQLSKEIAEATTILCEQSGLAI